MKKLFFLTLIAVVCLYGFRGSGWRGDTSKDGDYTFNDDVYITDSLYAGRASIGGTLIKSNGSIVMANGDSTTWRNSTGADSDYVYDDGTNMVVKSDNANILLITGTDTVKIVNGAVKPKVVKFNIWNSIDNVVGASKNTISGLQDFVGGGSFPYDSLIIDSVRALFYVREDSIVIDSFFLGTIYSYPAGSSISIIANGTDKVAGVVGWYVTSYTCAATIPTDGRYCFQFKPNKESAAGKLNCYNITACGHPK